MPVKTTTTNINALFETIGALSDTDKIAERVAQRGAEIAREQYGERKVTVSVEKGGDGVRRVVAEGANVAFDEFGTGYYAQGTYEAATEGEGRLPMTPITFESGGLMHTTHGWQYYYPSAAKAMKNGRYGWYINPEVFVTGAPSKAFLWKAGKRLRGELHTAKIADILGNGESNV